MKSRTSLPQRIGITVGVIGIAHLMAAISLTFMSASSNGADYRPASLPTFINNLGGGAFRTYGFQGVLFEFFGLVIAILCLVFALAVVYVSFVFIYWLATGKSLFADNH